ncbi:response regulator [Siphonobacter sp. BAB-5385]|uniref:response regulator n=1 Tax=unclassified Siphonobacter TaxID=2635712 RepID=UPI000B9E40E3|nr:MULTISPECIES: response regulator [unclassified Siphonobacter]OZI09906.1 response regulator [Siphonobacter sp. BAB-5385]PMD92506.1 response regulator [Siphonobacter sp. BAB-5405]
MSTKGPIISVEDDEDDQFLIRDVLKELGVTNEILFFSNGQLALDYLTVTTEQPFLILCDVNMPVMNGLELHAKIADNEVLRRKAIPFVFLTTAANANLVNEAYMQSVQGFYQKASSFETFQKQLEAIIIYWRGCLHPNNFQ